MAPRAKNERRGSKPGEKRGGRKKGGLNKMSKELREIARQYTPEAMEKLKSLMSVKDKAVALNAVREMLDRGWGRIPIPASEMSQGGGQLTVNLIRFGEVQRPPQGPLIEYAPAKANGSGPSE